jgi:hypothetical protein
MRVVTISEAPVAGPMLEERLTGLYRRKQVVDDLIRSLEQYGRFPRYPGSGRKLKGPVPTGAPGVCGLLRT